MKSLRISLLIIGLIQLANNISGQVQWPLAPASEQHSITGTYGECRFTNTAIRFHQGVDMINGSNYKVYASRAGLLNILSPTVLTVTNSEGYTDTYIHVNSCPVPNSTWINAGTQIGTMVMSKPIHLHFESYNGTNLNALAHRLSPYIDYTSPQINAFSIRRNGHTYQNSTVLYPETYNFQNQLHSIIYNKVDIVVNASDAMAGTCAPSRLSYNLLNAQNVSVTDGEVCFLNFEQSVLNATANYCYGPGTSLSPTTYNYVLTANPRTQPYDRYFNTGLRTNVAETWPADNSLDARHNGESLYPDGKYTVQIKVKDVDYDQTANVFTENHPVIVDNFRPYIEKVDVRKNSPTGTLYYQGKWDWDDQVLKFTEVLNNPLINPTQIHIKFYSSEPMMNIILIVGSSNWVLVTPVAGSNGREWEVNLPATAFAEGNNCMIITGQDYALNEVLGFTSTASINSSSFPVKRDNGTWSAIVNSTKDQVHCFTIETQPLPEAAFIPAEVTINPGDIVQFTDVSTGEPYQWDWAFEGGDPSWSPLQNPEVTYDIPGTYNVTMYIENSTGSSNCTGLVHVTEDVIPPEAAFNPDELSITPGTTISFSDLSTGNPDQWFWDFDGAAPPSIDKDPVVEFNQEGTYIITLIVSNSAGTSTATGTLEVSIYNTPLETMCQVNPFMGVVGTSVNFNASVINGSPPFQYFIDFGDGTYESASDFSAFMDFQHTYNQNGEYLLVGLITDAEGRSNSCQEQVSIYGGNPCASLNPQFIAASGNFSVEVNTPCTFEDASSGGSQPYWYVWNFEGALNGSGAPSIQNSTSQNPPDVIYDQAGNYPVKLHICDNAGCGATVKKIVKVFQPEHCITAKIGSGEEDYTQLTVGQAEFFDFSHLVSKYECSSPPGSGVMPCETDALWKLMKLPTQTVVASKHTHPMDPETCAFTTVNDRSFEVNITQFGEYLLTLHIWDNNCLVQTGYDCQDDDEMHISVVDCNADIDICQISQSVPSQSKTGRIITIGGPTCTALYLPGADIRYTANQEIRIFEGFHASQGSEFIAEIDHCPAGTQTYHAFYQANEGRKESEIEICPNPCEGKFSINGLDNTIKYNLQLIDVTGREVINRELTGSVRPEIQLPGIPPGIYSIILTGGRKGNVFKLAICEQ